MSEFFHYTLFGLHLRSAIMLPELAEADAGEPDVVIELGVVPAPADHQGQRQIIESGAVISVDGIANYAIRGGNRITVEPQPGAAERNVRLFLLGSAMGMLLHQRGLLPLHANGIAIEGHAMLFMGASGAGKSTLASWFVSRGYRLLADDVCALGQTGGRHLAMPGIPRFRLWEDAVRRQGRPLDGLSLSYAGDENYRKFDVPVALSDRASGELPVGGIYVLQRATEASLTPATGVAALQELYAHTYRGEYVAELGLQRQHLTLCSALANEVPMFVARRTWDLGHMGQHNGQLLAHALALVGRG